MKKESAYQFRDTQAGSGDAVIEHRMKLACGLNEANFTLALAAELSEFLAEIDRALGLIENRADRPPVDSAEESQPVAIVIDVVAFRPPRNFCYRQEELECPVAVTHPGKVEGTNARSAIEVLAPDHGVGVEVRDAELAVHVRRLARQCELHRGGRGRANELRRREKVQPHEKRPRRQHPGEDDCGP